jgi:short-subunit dehydrogenase
MLAVVTGASSAVGRATAREFARRGCDVAILARTVAPLEATAEELRGDGVKALAIAADIAAADAVEAAAERIETELGPIDCWVNNATGPVSAAIDQASPEEFRRATEFIYLGQVHGTMAALARMRRRDRGTVVTVDPAATTCQTARQSAYCGAKSAVRGFTEAVHRELTQDGSAVRMVLIHLPAVDTPLADATNGAGRGARPSASLAPPETLARAIVDAALRPRHREVWVGVPTLLAALGNRLTPSLLDRRLTRPAHRPPAGGPAPANGPDGPLVASEHNHAIADPAPAVGRHRGQIALGLVGLGCLGIAAWFGRAALR